MTTNPFDIDKGPESPELLAIAEKELRETPEIKAKGLSELRELLKQNPDLTYSEEDEFLIIILRACHWYPESAIKMVNNINLFHIYYTHECLYRIINNISVNHFSQLVVFYQKSIFLHHIN